MKYIIEIPKPEKCTECHMAQSIHYYGTPFCSITRGYFTSDAQEGIMEGCPLREVSE